MSYRLISKGNRGINKYKITIELGTDIYGKRRRLTKNVKCTKSEVEKLEGKLKSQNYHTSEKVETKLNNFTFCQMSNYFLKELCDAKPVTKKKYRKLLERINSIIGNQKLTKITPIMLKGMYSKLKQGKKKELSGSSMNELYKIINQVLDEAVNLEFISENPNKKIKKPKLNEYTPKYYNIEQINKLLSCLEKENIKWRTIIILALESSCRRGELCALKWSSLNFDTKVLTINNSLKVVDGVVYEDGPKTKNSYRKIILSDTMISLLKEYKEWQDNYIKVIGDKWKDNDYIFTSKYGGNMHPDSFNTMLSRIIKRNNLDYISFHGLRHTSCSIMVNKHINLRTITDRMGHSKVPFMLDRYAHSFPEEDIASAKTFEEIFKNA